MMQSRTMPVGVLIPVLHYPSVTEAVQWLSTTFGFELRWQVADHRAQLAVGPDAAIAVARGTVVLTADHVMIRVEDADAHRTRARQAGADAGDVQDQAFGERQYVARDLVGRTWVFTQTIADLAPEDWGAAPPARSTGPDSPRG